MISRNNQLFELISLFDSFKRQGLRELDFIHLKEMKDSFQNLMISSQTSSSKDLEVFIFGYIVFILHINFHKIKLKRIYKIILYKIN